MTLLRSLPELARSLRWYRRESIRLLHATADRCHSARVAAAVRAQANRLRAKPLVQLRVGYTALRVAEIRETPLWEMQRALGGRMTIVSAEAWMFSGGEAEGQLAVSRSETASVDTTEGRLGNEPRSNVARRCEGSNPSSSTSSVRS